MRAAIVWSTVAAVCALAACSGQMPGGGQTGGVAGTTSAGGDTETGSGGGGGAGDSGGTGETAGSGGITGAAGTVSTGGTDASGTAGASGGAVGGNAGSGAPVGVGGSSSQGGRGGTSAMGGTGASAGASGRGGATTGSAGSGGTTAVAYQGPCDVLVSGCAEAFGLARAMTLKYTGPLFQLGLAKDKTKLLDIGQTSDHKADMTTWSAFCGGSTTNCVVSKIYAQIHKGPNDLVPGVFKTPWNPDCSAGGFTCAGKFTIEAATGLPMVTTDSPQEYSLAGDAFATGINGGSKAMGIMYHGKPIPNQVYCCGVIGLTHKYNAEDVSVRTSWWLWLTGGKTRAAAASPSTAAPPTSTAWGRRKRRTTICTTTAPRPSRTPWW